MRKTKAENIGSNPSGRTKKGTFAPGNPGGPGRKPGAELLRQLIRECTTDEDIREIIAVLVTRAKRGDMVAIKEFFDRFAGKAQPADPDRLELSFVEETPESIEELRQQIAAEWRRKGWTVEPPRE